MTSLPKRSESMKGVVLDDTEQKSDEKVVGMMITHLQQLDAEISFLTGELTRMKRDMLSFAYGLEEVKRVIKDVTAGDADTTAVPK